MATGSVVTLCPATQITFSASALKPWSSNVIDTTCGLAAHEEIIAFLTAFYTLRGDGTVRDNAQHHSTQFAQTQ
jgi:hypothetical protein